MSFRNAVGLLRETAREFGRDECASMAASIAYFSLLSLPPLLAVLVALAGTLYADAEVQEAVAGQLGGVLGADAAEQIRAMIEGAREAGSNGLGRVLGVAALVFGATGAFAQLQQALNRAWDVRPDPRTSFVKTFVTKRLLSLGMILTIALLLAVSLVLSTAVSLLADQLGALIGGAGALFARAASLVLPLVLFTLLFAAVFKVLPDADVRWEDVWVGAFATALLFVVGKYLFSLYFSTANVGAAFGAAGSVVVVLVWIYYTALLLLLGAEFTQVYARRHGAKILPSKGAVLVEREEREVPREALLDEREGEERAGGEEGAGDEAGRVDHPYVRPRPPSPREGFEPEPGRG